MGAALLPLAIGGAGIAGGQYMKRQEAEAQKAALPQLLQQASIASGPQTMATQAFGPTRANMAQTAMRAGQPEMALKLSGLDRVMASPPSPKDRYSNVDGVGLVDLYSPGGPTTAIPKPQAAERIDPKQIAFTEWRTKNPGAPVFEFEKQWAAAGRAPEKPEAPKDPDFKNIYDAASGQLIGTFDTRRPDVAAGLNSGKYTFAEKRQDKPTQGENTYAYHATRIASALSDIQGVLSKNKDAATTLIPGDNALSKKLRGDDVNIVQSALPELGDALLTLGTGAAYTQIQFDNQWTANLPAVGDSDAVLSKKFGRIEALYERAKKNAGSQGVDLPSIQSIAALYKKSSPDTKKTPSQSMGGYGGTNSGWSFEPVGN